MIQFVVSFFTFPVSTEKLFEVNQLLNYNFIIPKYSAAVAIETKQRKNY